MNKRTAAAALWVGLALTLLTASPALAEDSSYRRAMMERAFSEGFGRSEVESLSITVTSDRQGRADQLRELAASGQFGRLLSLRFDTPTQDGKKTLSFVGEQGYLQVYADGSHFKLRGDLDKVTPVEVIGGNERISLERSERLGRDFIQGPLSRFVPLQQNETLTFLGARYLRQGGGSVRETTSKEYLLANIAIFAREVNGIPVIGSGSKIAIWLTADEKVIGFDVDWPHYKQDGAAEALVSKDELIRRVEAVAVPLSGTKDAKVRRFECGYVDLGATRRNSATPIQAGCAVAFYGPERDGTSPTYARLEFVPAARTVYADAHWPVATHIAREGEPKPGLVLTTPGAEPAPSDPWPDEPIRSK